MSLIDERVINTLFVSDNIITSGKLGVGTQTPLSAFHVVGDTRLEGAVAEGINTVATYTTSHAEGHTTKAEGDCAHAEGSNTRATAFASHAEGGYSLAVGGYSHAEGNHTATYGEISHAAGHQAHAMHNQSWIWRGHTINNPSVPALSTDRVGQFKAVATGGIFLSGSSGVGINTDGIAGMALTIGGYTQITNAYDGALRLYTPASPAHNRIGIEFGTNNGVNRLWTLIQDPAAAADTNLVIRRLVDVNQPFVLNLKQDGQHIASDNWTFQGTVSTVGNISTTGQIISAGVDISSLFGSGGGGGVTQIVAGNNVTISPAGGTGAVTINASDTGVRAITGVLSEKVFDMQFDYAEYDLSSTSFTYITNSILALPFPVLMGGAYNAAGSIDTQVRLIIYQDFGGSAMEYGLDYWTNIGSGAGPDGSLTWNSSEFQHVITRGPAGAGVETIITDWKPFFPAGTITSLVMQLEARRTTAGTTRIKRVYLERRRV